MPSNIGILVLGGSTEDLEREKRSAELARKMLFSRIFISSGGSPKQVRKIFTGFTDRLYLSYESTDTVSNFTSMIPVFKTHGINEIVIITSQYHVRRSKAIACIILSHHGIKFRFESVPSDQKQECLIRIVRDELRSIFWILTGFSFQKPRQLLKSQIGQI